MHFLLTLFFAHLATARKKNFFEKEKPVWIGNFSEKIAKIFKKNHRKVVKNA